MRIFFLALTSAAFLMSCKQSETKQISEMQKKVDQFVGFTLTSDISDLSENEKEMLRILIEAAEIMDNLFWQQAFGEKQQALELTNDSVAQKFILINYGPWERLNGNMPFIEGIGEKPLGAQFYPSDMTKEEFEAFQSEDKASLYTIIRRDSANRLISIPYHKAYKVELTKASQLLKKAAALAEDPGLKIYLELRSEALITSNYLASDLAWMDMKTNRLDFVVGPIENYEDQLYNYKAAFEAYVLIKDMEWSKKLDRFAALLPALQKKLPVEDRYKAETPGTNSDLGAYDVVYYAGDCNAGSKTIAINLPNDPIVHKEKGSRRLQLKNAMQAKYEKIMVPIAQTLINPDQQKHLTFDAFFENTMLHEVAHGIGISYTLTTGEEVRTAMKDKSTALEEGKADILGVFLVKELIEMGELETDIMNNYVTFTAGLFRSIRFGASSAHGVSNLIRYNYFLEQNAMSRSAEGIYTIDAVKMEAAINGLTEIILKIQGDGDYAAAVNLVEKYGQVSSELQQDLDKINQQNIPVDIVFEQGTKVLGLSDCNKTKCPEKKKCCKEKQ
ncbi:MAG: Zn-dependent hydrolase [Bacteroidota bacterium]|nr:MAG: Zn-dependent hydrolase [Bacteroidota bacterium]